LWAGFLDGDGDLVLELDTVAQPIIDIEVRHLIGTSGRIAISDEAEVDLPMAVTGSLGIVSAERRTALGMGGNGDSGEEKREGEMSQ